MNERKEQKMGEGGGGGGGGEKNENGGQKCDKATNIVAVANK